MPRHRPAGPAQGEATSLVWRLIDELCARASCQAAGAHIPASRYQHVHPNERQNPSRGDLTMWPAGAEPWATNRGRRGEFIHSRGSEVYKIRTDMSRSVPSCESGQAGPVSSGHAACRSRSLPVGLLLRQPRPPSGKLSCRQYTMLRAAKREEQLKQAPEISESEAGQPSTSASPQPTRGPAVKGSALSSSWRRVLRPLANIKLAIAELTAIAVLSAIGTVIEQNKQPTFYVQNFPEQGT